jgi:hypothetical protein
MRSPKDIRSERIIGKIRLELEKGRVVHILLEIADTIRFFKLCPEMLHWVSSLVRQND